MAAEPDAEETKMAGSSTPSDGQILCVDRQRKGAQPLIMTNATNSLDAEIRIMELSDTVLALRR
jgi:hypothetical protein